MKSDLIEHPCVVCGGPSRSCGHTSADKRAYYDRCREIRRAAKQAQGQPRRRAHKVPVEGPDVFLPQPGASGQVVLVKMGGKVVRCRIPAGAPLKRDEYGEPPPRKGDAA